MLIDITNPENIKDFLKNTTDAPGIYKMFSAAEEILYVGKARNIKKRLASYFNKQDTSVKTAALVKQIHAIETIITNTEAEALILECNLIKQFRPKYNILLRDDKSYPYICISKHNFSRIYLTRVKNNKKTKDALYFGPYPNAVAAKETIKLIQQVFLLRTCTDSYFKNRARPCLLYQIHRCSAPCVANISQQDYAENIKNTRLFLEGKSQELISNFALLMDKAADVQAYEQAAVLRDKIQKLQAIFAPQYIENAKLSKKATDVIAYLTSGHTLVLAILQFREGSLRGSKEYIDKVLFDIHNPDIFEDELLSALSQFYLDLAQSSRLTMPDEIVLNFIFDDHNKDLLKDIISPDLVVIDQLKTSQKKWLQLAEKNAKNLLEKHKKQSAIFENQFILLKQELNLAKIPNRIECFDVSHTFGDQTIASCVVYTPAGPDKSSYRKYNIKNVNSVDNPNDTAAMYEVLMRRYKKIIVQENTETRVEMPELVLIDGGKPQVNVAKKVFADLNYALNLGDIKTKIYGITKGEGRRAEFDRILDAETMEFVNISDKSLAKHLLQQIRDEAHRFAITGHRAKRDKKQMHSVLEDLPRIGAKRRRILLTHLGGWQQIQQATLEQLATVPGISANTAKMIYDHLHGNK